MMQTTASDGEVPFGSNDSEDLNRLKSDVPPNIHCDPDLPQLDICHDDLPRVLPYPPTPLYRGTDRLKIEQDFHNPVPDADPTPPSQLSLTQPNLGDHHPSLSLPVVSMDGTFMLPSTAEDRPAMTVTASVMRPTTSDGKVPFGKNNSEDHNSDIFPNLHRDPDPPQLDIYRGDLPHEARGLPYPQMPSYHGMDRPDIQQDFRDPVPDADPIPPSPLPLMQPNLGDYRPSFSLPVRSMRDTFTLPSTAEDRSTVTVTAQTSQAGPNSTAKRPAHVNVTERASKKDLKQVKQYLESIHPENVEKGYGRGRYIPWHGDGKSQSRTNITFQTKSMCTSGKPPTYITIIARKGRTEAYVTYESSTWSESARTIIDEMIKAIKV
ncbi:hypothetical protein BDR03DRAFT_937021 [Suillus americanus]|nr:hypothetical protein BDR03DRAFT_937021 [Suillus americanus]